MSKRQRVLLTQDDGASSAASSARTRDRPLSELSENVSPTKEKIDDLFSPDSIVWEKNSQKSRNNSSKSKKQDNTVLSDIVKSANSGSRRNTSLDIGSDELQNVEEEEETAEEDIDVREEGESSMYMGGVSGDESWDEQSQGGEEVQDSDFDTDLEMNDDKWLNPERYDRDTTGIVKYRLACKNVGVQPIRYFIRHMQDERLKLSHRGLGPDAMRALAAPLECNTTIEHMDLEGNWILAEGTAYLCKVLRENVFVTHLNLSENNIENEGAIIIFDLLKSNKTIENVELAGNNIGDSIGEVLHRLLTSSSTLKSLNLCHNKLEDGAAKWIKDALVDNETLEHLDISWNHFQGKGCVLLAEGLKENVGLKEFAVSMNGFGKDGGKALGEALQVNRTLLRLETRYCRLPFECAIFLAQGLMQNDCLCSFDVSHNCLKAEGAFAMLTGIEKNDSSALMLFNLGNARVEIRFKDLQETLHQSRGLEVVHGGVLEDYREEVMEIDPMEAFKRDPMTKLKEWVTRAGYRLIDLLYHFDKDQSMSISVDEFREGIAQTNIPITEEQLQILVTRLDKDGDGEIDFSELVAGDKDHRKTKRDIHKYISEKQEQERQEESKDILKALSPSAMKTVSSSSPTARSSK